MAISIDNLSRFWFGARMGIYDILLQSHLGVDLEEQFIRYFNGDWLRKLVKITGRDYRIIKKAPVCSRYGNAALSEILTIFKSETPKVNSADSHPQSKVALRNHVKKDITALIWRDSDWRIVKRRGESEVSGNGQQKRGKLEGNNLFSKPNSVTSWVEQVARESSLRSTTTDETISQQILTIPDYPEHLCPESFSMSRNLREPDDGQSNIGTETDQNTASTSRPNDTSYTLTLEGYRMFTDEYDPPKELLEAVKAILWKPRNERLDLGTALQICQNAHRLRKASEDVVSSTIGPDLFPFLFKAPDKLCVSKNTEWTEALNISSPEGTFLPLPSISLPKPDVAVGCLNISGGRTCFRPARQERRPVSQPSGGNKSAGTKGRRYVGTDQANLSMGTMLLAFQKIYHHVYGQDLFAVMEPRAFSIVFDQELVTFNFEWMFQNSRNNQVVNLHQTEGFWLGRSDDVCKAYDMGQNIKDWLLNNHIPWVQKLLDDFWKKVDSAQQNLASNKKSIGFKRRRSTKTLQGQSSQRSATPSQASS
ncbi:MAG: hypothetical protein Q9217_003897 [Psora testacea]